MSTFFCVHDYITHVESSKVYSLAGRLFECFHQSESCFQQNDLQVFIINFALNGKPSYAKNSRNLLRLS